MKYDFASYVPCLAQFVCPRRLGQRKNGGDSGFHFPRVDQGSNLGELGGVRVNEDPFTSYAVLARDFRRRNAQGGHQDSSPF